jgi:hypothetical protein
VIDLVNNLYSLLINGLCALLRERILRLITALYFGLGYWVGYGLIFPYTGCFRCLSVSGWGWVGVGFGIVLKSLKLTKFMAFLPTFLN